MAPEEKNPRAKKNEPTYMGKNPILATGQPREGGNEVLPYGTGKGRRCHSSWRLRGRKKRTDLGKKAAGGPPPKNKCPFMQQKKNRQTGQVTAGKKRCGGVGREGRKRGWPA